ncbi:hypothetical protein ACIRD3_13525 [Kitasatospora sp. NPDC093550]|uniref:hypothetical protein n=1 Tax=Kitasatospora sp. NPDC093550 TaxID=3364089 RepID=UPI00380A1583
MDDTERHHTERHDTERHDTERHHTERHDIDQNGTERNGADRMDDVEALRHLHDAGDYLRLAERTSHPEVLRRLAVGEYSFVWHAIARNAAAPADLLVALSTRRHSTWNDNHLLQLLAVHPALTGADLDGLVDLLAARLREGDRPYAAVLALARRPEPSAERLHGLGQLPGASTRLRRGITRALAARPER